MAKALYRKERGLSPKTMARQYQVYLKKTKGMSQMSRRQFYKFNYGIEPPEFRTPRTKDVERQLRQAGATSKEIRRLRGKR